MQNVNQLSIMQDEHNHKMDKKRDDRFNNIHNSNPEDYRIQKNIE